MYCRHCGKELADDSKFCSSCGKSLDLPAEKSTAFAPVEKVEEKPSIKTPSNDNKNYDVVVYDFGKNKLLSINIIQGIQKTSLAESKKALKNLPLVLIKNVSYENATNNVADLQKMGITAKVVKSGELKKVDTTADEDLFEDTNAKPVNRSKKAKIAGGLGLIVAILTFTASMLLLFDKIIKASDENVSLFKSLYALTTTLIEKDFEIDFNLYLIFDIMYAIPAIIFAIIGIKSIIKIIKSIIFLAKPYKDNPHAGFMPLVANKKTATASFIAGLPMLIIFSGFSSLIYKKIIIDCIPILVAYCLECVINHLTTKYDLSI